MFIGNTVYSNFNTFTQKINSNEGFFVNINKQDENKDINSNILNQEISKEKLDNTKETTEDKNTKPKNWCVEIPSINLKANIAEGTSKETMDQFVGHFEETAKSNGNIGLAAHNRGYENNYFADLKKLKKGDKIVYTYEKFRKEYVVTNHVIIENTDWTYLENTDENLITLITCVENEPKYRRCIQGEEI